MKTIAEITQNHISSSDGKLVHYQAVVGGWRKLDVPTMSTDLKCAICQGVDHGVVIATPIGSTSERVWICHTRNCASNKDLSHRQSMYPLPNKKRAIEWALFCELNTLGDVHHDVSFEKIVQSSEKIAALRDFLTSDNPFLIMQGSKGAGKTYASLGVCELFTRTNISCIFTTHARMKKDFYNSDLSNNYIARVTNVNLLVLDDFGLIEPEKNFMEFFMDLVNTRMQWKKRKTIFTTNIDSEKFIQICGDALTDRLKRAIRLKFNDSSRR